MFENVKNFFTDFFSPKKEEVKIEIDGSKQEIERLFKKASVLYENKNYEKAIVFFKRILKIDPNNLNANNNLGLFYADLKNYEKAIPYFEEALKIDPNNSNANNNLGACYLGLKDYEKAIPCLEKELSIDPNNLNANYNLGTYYSELKDYEKAISYYENILIFDPNNSNANNNLGVCFLYIGISKKDIEYFKKAIFHFEKCLKINFNDLNINNNLGDSFLQLKDYEKSISYYEKVLKIDSNNSNANNNLGVCYSELKDYEEAIPYFEKCLSISPNELNANYNLGFCNLGLKNYEKAIPYYKKVLIINPNDLKTNYNLGIFYSELKDYEEAIPYFEKVLIINPNNLNVTYNLGVNYYKLKDYEKSIFFYEKCLKIDHNDLKTNYNLGVCYSELKDYEEAIPYFEKCLSISPNELKSNFSLGRIYLNQITFDNMFKIGLKVYIGDNKELAKKHFKVALKNSSKDKIIRKQIYTFFANELYECTEKNELYEILEESIEVFEEERKNTLLPKEREKNKVDSQDIYLKLLELNKNLLNKVDSNSKIEKDIVKNVELTKTRNYIDFFENRIFITPEMILQNEKIKIVLDKITTKREEINNIYADLALEPEISKKESNTRGVMFRGLDIETPAIVDKLSNDIDMLYSEIMLIPEVKAGIENRLGKVEDYQKAKELFDKNIIEKDTGILQYYLSDKDLIINLITNDGLITKIYDKEHAAIDFLKKLLVSSFYTESEDEKTIGYYDVLTFLNKYGDSLETKIDDSLEYKGFIDCLVKVFDYFNLPQKNTIIEYIEAYLSFIGKEAYRILYKPVEDEIKTQGIKKIIFCTHGILHNFSFNLLKKDVGTKKLEGLVFIEDNMLFAKAFSLSVLLKNLEKSETKKSDGDISWLGISKAKGYKELSQIDYEKASIGKLIKKSKLLERKILLSKEEYRTFLLERIDKEYNEPDFLLELEKAFPQISFSDKFSLKYLFKKNLFSNEEVTEDVIKYCIKTSNFIQISTHGVITENEDTSGFIMADGTILSTKKILNEYPTAEDLDILVLLICFGGQLTIGDADEIFGFIPVMFSIGAKSIISNLITLNDKDAKTFCDLFASQKITNIDNNYKSNWLIFHEIQKRNSSKKPIC